MTRTAYLAGPLFTHAERLWNLELAQAIRAQDETLDVFLPQVETRPALQRTPPDFAAVQRICLEGIDSCSVVLAVLDGADSDSGTSFECGYAFAKRKPIIGIRTDPRGGEDQGLNAMLSRSCDELIALTAGQGARSELVELAGRIVAAVGKLGHDREAKER